jgi:hypothetical protein
MLMGYHLRIQFKACPQLVSDVNESQLFLFRFGVLIYKIRVAVCSRL